MPDTRPRHDGPSGTPRILIADADDDARSLVREALGVAGCDVVEASDGREALTEALVREPALVISELRLPLIDGYALCEILRRDRTTATVPILIVTTEERSGEVERARQAGADAVLVKPTTPETLLNEIRRLMARSASPTTAAQFSEPSTVLTRAEEPRRKPLAKAHARSTTTTPPASPPELTCPSCDCALRYERSHIGGVSRNHPEQWDEFVCPDCGTFEYRHRTRKLRRTG
jgi:CheY-like chemotaxis protein